VSSLVEYATVAAVIILVLFCAMIAAFFVGRKYGFRFRTRAPSGTDAGIDTVQAAFFALLGLLLAFTFAGAAERFDDRRKLIVSETDAIDTAYRRLDLLPAAAQSQIRAEFARYVDARIETYRVLPDIEASQRWLAKSHSLQDSIWQEAVLAVADAKLASTPTLVLGSLNTMLDLMTERTAVTEMHPPAIIYVMLAAYAVAGMFFIGFEMSKDKTFSKAHAAMLAATLATIVYVNVDYEFPRAGLIRVSAMDQLLVDVRKTMK
jgi:hypothetical protein